MSFKGRSKFVSSVMLLTFGMLGGGCAFIVQPSEPHAFSATPVLNAASIRADGAETQPTTQPTLSGAKPAFSDRVFVVGWSLAGGFGTSRELGFDAPLALAIEQMIRRPHTPVQSSVGGAFFSNPAASGKKQLERARAAQATALVAIDFPFWYVYGMALSNARRTERLKECLELLDGFKDIPVVVGTCPTLKASGNALADFVVRVNPFYVVEVNQLIRDWAKERPNVVLVDLQLLLDDVRAQKAVTLGPNSFPADCEKRLVQPDGLHPTLEGLCAIAAFAVDSLRRLENGHETEYVVDLKTLYAEAERKALEEKKAREAAATK